MLAIPMLPLLIVSRPLLILLWSGQAIEDAALAVMETYKALEGQLEEKKASLTAMEKEFEKHKAVVAKARSAQVDVENELQVRWRCREIRRGHRQAIADVRGVRCCLRTWTRR